jgi:predicted AlkP superfamily phosphohydrolase/phosphomutase
MVKLPGEELDEWHTSFDRRMLLAETLWEAGNRVGKKSALINWPVTWPKGGYENCVQVAGSLNPPFRYFYMPLWDIAGSSFYSTEKHYCNQVPGRAVVVRPARAEGWTNLPKSSSPPLELEITVPPVYVEGIQYSVLVVDSGGKGYDEMWIGPSKDASKAIARLKVRQYSDWITEDFSTSEGKRRGRFRFQPIEISPDGSTVKLFVTAINTADSYTVPEDLTETLEAAVGPYMEVDDPWAYLDQWVDLEHYMDQLQFHADWWGNATKFVLETQEWDMAFSWVGTVDHLQHVLYAGIVEESHLYDPKKYELCMDGIRRGYRQLDENIGRILEAVDLDETLVITVSDHGFTHNDWNPYLKHFLAKAGLLSYTLDSDTGEMKVDWSRTKCHPLEPSHAHIFINLKGRDPQGIVDPEDYRKVQEQIKQALMQIRDPITGDPAMAAVLTKEEASTVNVFEGKGFDRVGDVLFAFKPGYLANTFIYPAAVKYKDGTERIIPNPEECEPSELGRHFSGAHVTLPGIREMECAVVFSGVDLPRFERKLPMDIVDIAPTVATLMGIPVPKDAEGGIVAEVVENRSHG